MLVQQQNDALINLIKLLYQIIFLQINTILAKRLQLLFAKRLQLLFLIVHPFFQIALCGTDGPETVLQRGCYRFCGKRSIPRGSQSLVHLDGALQRLDGALIFGNGALNHGNFAFLVFYYPPP